MPNPAPLQSLLLFESVARHLSFTAVADEFGMSQPAVSQRIASLEKELDATLFQRSRRGVALTPDGRALHEAVRDHLAALQLALDKFRRRRTRQILTVATDFAFAHFWLMPRLASFQALRPELDVRIVTSQAPFDLRDEPVDLAISFGEGHWPGCDARQILPEVVVPVCSPSLLARLEASPRPADVLRLPLLHLDGGERARWMTWEDWAHGHDLPFEGGGHSLTLGNYPLLIQAAMAGHGVALGWRPLVDELLRFGQLVAMPAAPLTTRRGYYLVTGHGRAPWEALDHLREWIVRAVRTDTHAA